MQVSAVRQYRFASCGAGRGGRGSEREQSACWGRDIGVSNKQTTDTYKYVGCTRAILKSAQCSRQPQGDRAQTLIQVACVV